MPLTDAEKERTRYHLGYLSVSTAASLSFGIPVPQQTLFLVESAMNRVIEASIDRIRRILSIMDGIECQLVDAQPRLAASKLGDLELRLTETDSLEREYARWGYRLANILGVPVYPYAERYQYGAGVKAGNVPVR